jgi:hypothetical protein
MTKKESKRTVKDKNKGQGKERYGQPKTRLERKVSAQNPHRHNYERGTRGTCVEPRARKEKEKKRSEGKQEKPKAREGK